MSAKRLKRFFFRVVELDESTYWDAEFLERAGGRIVTHYLFREGEATHCASLFPSSWCVFLRHELAGDDVTDAQRDWFHDQPEAHSGDDFYHAYIDVQRSGLALSSPQEFRAETTEEAWEMALGWNRGNWANCEKLEDVARRLLQGFLGHSALVDVEAIAGRDEEVRKRLLARAEVTAVQVASLVGFLKSSGRLKARQQAASEKAQRVREALTRS